MNLVMIKYNAGNTQSVLYALERIGAEAVISDDPDTIRSADKVVFPGVGEASSALRSLQQAGLDKVIGTLKQPVLGICVGMQLLCTHSEENDTQALDIIPVNVKKFPASETIKVPQIGWNNLYDLKGSLFETIAENSYTYYVNSYYAEMSEYTIATSNYGLPFSGAIAKDNFYGVQFHAEKSAQVGSRILENFIRL